MASSTAIAVSPPIWENLQVIKISDGDTIKIRLADGSIKSIRVAGIDAPEVCQPYWRVSRDFLSQTLGRGKGVSIYPYKTDKYGREVANVYVRGKDVGLDSVKSGFAWHTRKYTHEQPAEVRTQYEQAEREAQARRAGLWADPQPKAPWDYRGEKRANGNKTGACGD
jgi:endonuclease YncB( thermonuclease family)